jgi:hypothetical protein
MGLWVFENKVLRRLSGPKRDEIIGDRRKWIMMNFITYAPCQI